MKQENPTKEEMKIVVYNQNELHDSIIKKICSLKKQFWNYSLASQIKYIKELPASDKHILALKNNNPIGYLRFVKRQMILPTLRCFYAGISTVCVDFRFQSKGLGKQLMAQANDLINGDKELLCGLLQCDPANKKFYVKCDWEMTDIFFYKLVDKKQVPFFNDACVMLYTKNSLFNYDKVELEGTVF